MFIPVPHSRQLFHLVLLTLLLSGLNPAFATVWCLADAERCPPAERSCRPADSAANQAADPFQLAPAADCCCGPCIDIALPQLITLEARPRPLRGLAPALLDLPPALATGHLPQVPRQAHRSAPRPPGPPLVLAQLRSVVLLH